VTKLIQRDKIQQPWHTYKNCVLVIAVTSL